MIKLFPVKSSAPAITTRIKPTGKTAPLANLARPVFSILWDIVCAAKPPNAINKPARIPKMNKLEVELFALPTDTPSKASAVSFGLKKLLITVCLLN